jgi:hypothetical protein
MRRKDSYTKTHLWSCEVDYALKDCVGTERFSLRAKSQTEAISKAKQEAEERCYPVIAIRVSTVT